MDEVLAVITPEPAGTLEAALNHAAGLLEPVPIGLIQPDRDKQALTQTLERFLIAKPVPTFAESALAGDPRDPGYRTPRAAALAQLGDYTRALDALAVSIG